MATKKQFLDYTGLSTFWGIINSTFATKAELTAVKDAAVGSFDDAVAAADTVTINAKSINGAVVDTITLNGATTAAAGLMTATDKSTLESLKETISANTDFKGLQINGNAIATETQANLKIEYDSDNKVLKLYDANNDSAVSTVDASAFVKDGMLDSVEVVESDGKQVLRFTWNTDAEKDAKDITDVELDKIITPYTSGEGITIANNTVSLNKAASDKLGGIKIGYTSADKKYAVELDTDGKAYVAVPWANTEYATGTQGTYVKVSVDGTSINTDETALSTALETLGSTKVDAASGDTYVNATTEGTTVKVAATDALKNAVTAANSALQTASGDTYVNATTEGTEVKVSATASTIASLGKADSALQNVTAEGTYITAGTKSDNAIALDVTDKLKDAVAAAETAVQTVGEGTGITVTKAGTTSTVGLNEASVASLAKADSAVQGVKIGDTVGVLDDNNVAVFEADAVVTALGFAALTTAEIYAACGLTYTPEA